MASILDLNPELRNKIAQATGGQPEGQLAGLDEFQGRPLPEVSVTARKRYDYGGCVTGMCHSMAEKYGESVEDFRKLNNMYGDAWDFNKNTYGQPVDISQGYQNLKEGDIINMSRAVHKSDKQRGIPDFNQHIGYISKVENGVPYVKHFVTHRGFREDGKTPYGEYYEEPIDKINAVFNYTPTGAKRLDYFKDINKEKSPFAFDKNYEPNEIEAGVLAAHGQKEQLQDILKLDSKEYDELAKVAYGIMGNESSFGRSKKSLYRMAVPDFIQKAVKVADDVRRGRNVYDENINNLSQGYSSTKESSLHGVSDNSEIKRSPQEVNKQIKEGNYKDLERTNNYLYTAMNKLGITPDNLENGENSTKAIMATLAWFKKRNPNATPEDLLKMYTGKKDIGKYKESFDQYLRNINVKPDDNLQYDALQNFYGNASDLANKSNAALKQLGSNITSFLRDKTPMPENAKVLLADLLGAKGEITEKTLSKKTLEALKKIVEDNLSKNKNTIGYDDYKTSGNKNEDVGEGKVSIAKMANDPNYILKTLLGQASIKRGPNGEVNVEDTYDFNDKGKSFGLLDDIQKRGLSPYALFRALGRNYGSEDNQGAKVKIKIK